MRTHFGFVEPLEARRLLSGVSLVQSTGTGGVAVQGGGDFLAAVHDTTFFVAARDGQWSLWVQQNAQSESHPLLLPNDSPYPPQKLIAHANTAFIFKYQELWSSDGTTKGTKKIVFPDDVYSVSEVGGRLLVSLGNPYGGGSCYIRDDSTGIFHKIVNTSGHSLAFDVEEASAIRNHIIFKEPESDKWFELDATVATPVATAPTLPKELLGADSAVDVGGWTYTYDTANWQVYQTNGTGAGTRPVPWTLIHPAGFKHTGWYFDQDKLYRIDPTTGNSTLALTLPAGGPVRTFNLDGPTVPMLYSTGDRLLFERVNGGTSEIWTSDGTLSGTKPLPKLQGVNIIYDPLGSGHPHPGIQISHGVGIFIGVDAAHGQEIWQTDGTDSGTNVFDLSAGFLGSNANGLEIRANNPYFFAKSARGAGLFRAAITKVNRSPVASISGELSVVEGGHLKLDASKSTDPDGDPLTYQWDLNGDGVFNDVVSYAPVTEIAWKKMAKLGITDGPATFTARLMVSDAFASPTSAPANLLVQNTPPTASLKMPRQILVGTIWTSNCTFTDYGQDAIQDFVVDWGDGSTTKYAGTKTTIAHKYAKAGSLPLTITATDEDGTFQALQTKVNGVEHLEGAVSISLRLGNASDFSFADLNGHVIYSARMLSKHSSLYASDGTENGSTLLLENKDITRVVRAGKYVYCLCGGTFDMPDAELWRTDGTVAGTKKLAGPRRIDSYTATVLNGQLVFRSFAVPDPDVPDTDGLWVTDTSSAGLHKVPLDENTKTFSFARTVAPVIFRGSFYWLGCAADGPFDTTLYRFDGATASAVVEVFKSAPDDTTLHVTSDWLFIDQGVTTDIDVTTAGVVYRTDGTAAGTTKVRATAKSDVHYTSLFAGAKTLFAVAQPAVNDMTGQELWVVGNDGMAHFVKDIYSGTASSDIKFLVNAGAYTYFSARDSVHGQALWRTDGTAAGTQLVLDARPLDKKSTTYGQFLASGPNLYFSVVADDHTAKLYRSNGTAAGTVALTASGALRGNSLVAHGKGALFMFRTSSTKPWQWWATDGTLKATTVLNWEVPQSDAWLSCIRIENDRIYLAQAPPLDPVNNPQKLDSLYRIYPPFVPVAYN